MFPKGHGFHTARHSYVTYATANGASSENVGKLVGQSSAYTTDRYSHPVPDVLREVAEAVGRTLRKAK